MYEYQQRQAEIKKYEDYIKLVNTQKNKIKKEKKCLKNTPIATKKQLIIY